jgi:L-asparaginase II
MLILRRARPRVVRLRPASPVARYHRPVPDPESNPSVAPAMTSRPKRRSSKTRRGAPPPVLVEVQRGETVESRHRGHVVQVSAEGDVVRAIGAPTTEVLLRSAIKPFGLVALIESGAADDLGLTAPELAVMAGSHAGEDKHVRTLQAIFRRANVTQALLSCGSANAPRDELTAARLARDGEAPGAVRHACSGYHAACILMSAHAGWSLDDYADTKHKSQLAIRDTVARLFGRKPESMKSGIDDCGIATYEMPLVEVARAYLLLADPEGPATTKDRASSAPALKRIRDAMMAYPDMVGGTYDTMDTELMRRRPGSLVSKSGADGLRGVGLLAASEEGGSEAAGIAVKIDDGDGADRASKAVSVEALAQVGTLDERDLRALGPFHHPSQLGPDGSEVATALPRFELAPLRELT